MSKSLRPSGQPPNNSFKPNLLRGPAHAVTCTATLGRYAGRLNSGVRLLIMRNAIFLIFLSFSCVACSSRSNTNSTKNGASHTEDCLGLSNEEIESYLSRKIIRQKREFLTHPAKLITCHFYFGRSEFEQLSVSMAQRPRTGTPGNDKHWDPSPVRCESLGFGTGCSVVTKEGIGINVHGWGETMTMPIGESILEKLQAQPNNSFKAMPLYGTP